MSFDIIGGERAIALIRRVGDQEGRETDLSDDRTDSDVDHRRRRCTRGEGG